MIIAFDLIGQWQVERIEYRSQNIGADARNLLLPLASKSGRIKTRKAATCAVVGLSRQAPLQSVN